MGWYGYNLVMKPVIICGGIGSKMWPVSRNTMPKHFVKFFDNKSLFQINYETLRQKFSPEDIFIQTNALQAKIAKEQVPDIPDGNFFIEPEMRNQGPATGFLAAKLFKKFPDEPFMLVQADVLRRPAEKFLETIEQFDYLIKRDGKLMTGGIRLKHGVAGIDFMVAGDKIENTGDVTIYKMKKWVMRDDPNRDESQIESGAVLGHANHYAWTPRLMLEAFKRRAPEWYEPLMKMVEAFDTLDEDRVVKEEYAKMPKDPIEARVTKYEMDDAYVVDLPFDWIDFGTWESLANFMVANDLYKTDENILEIDGSGNFISRPNGKYVATIGVENLVIVDTGDALLVLKKDKSGKVGEVVDSLKAKERNELL
jgi:mannose-1-phosphate guanylyltransferase